MHTRSYLAASALLLAALGCREDAGSPTDPTDTSPRATVSAATALSFWQMSAGGWHTCGVTTDYRAYCWGYNNYGQLGVGTEMDFAGEPTLVAGGLRFRHVSAGGVHTCGVTTDYRAYCWGANDGTIGDGTSTSRFVPTRVVGGLEFRQVEAGSSHTCGVTTTNQAYCWGWNEQGQLGDGTRTQRFRPVAVLGEHRFRQVSGGDNHTCGVTTTFQVFCWGWNKYGQIGDSSTVRRQKPSRVVGTRAFRQVDAGAYHTCAVTTGGRAFCWGDGRSGQLGNGKTYVSLWPRAVSGGLSFTRVGTSFSHTCGVTTGHKAYCWGVNGDGQLGIGTVSYPQLRPMAVVGGLSFEQLSAGYYHTCGKTSTGVGYCWGYNYRGQLGDGTTTGRLTPTRVADPL